MWSICFGLVPAFAQTRIFNANISALPGEAVSLQGNFGAAAKAYIASGSSSAALPILIQSAGQATVQLPNSLGLDVYQLWVEDQGQRSPSVYVNRARGMHFDSPEVGAGGPLRLFGRNLLLSGGTTQVRFQARNGGGGSGNATVLASQSDAYTLRMTAPSSLVAGVTYDVYVSNGLGGTAGETLVERSILGVAAGSDYFQLGVGWASKLNFTGNVYNVKTDGRLTKKATGDGNTDDRPAIQAAIDLAAANGGGIVYLPAGNYKLIYSGWGGLVMRNRVVVQGAGKTNTFVRFGYDAPQGYSGGGQAVHFDDGSSQSGLADIALINVDTQSKWIINLWATKSSELFLQRVRFDLNLGEWLMLRDNTKIVVANSDITQGIDKSSWAGPILMLGTTNAVVSGNTITYAINGLDFGNTQDCVIENNQIYRDGSARYPSSMVNHVLILGFAQNVAVKGNSFKVINGPAQNSNDGEAIIAEGGANDRIDEDAGTVSSATATTLQDNSKNWGTMRMRPVVAIVHGPGMGQWRSISSRSGNTLTVSQPWDVQPTSASRYAIFNWGSRSWLLQGNTFEGNQRGITLYGNATLDVAIVSNTLTNSGSIDLTPWQANQSNLGVPQEFLPMYNNQIIGNNVSNTNGSNGVFIGVHTVQYAQPTTFGTSVIGLEMRRNTVTAGQPNTPALVDTSYPEGYLNFLEFQQTSSAYTDQQEPAILGTIFQDNVANNCNNALRINSGAYNTLVCNTTLNNSPSLTEDLRILYLSHSSVNTVSCLASTSAGLRTPENPASTAAGLDYKYYEGFWDYLPNLSGQTPKSTGTSTTGFDIGVRKRDYSYVVSYTGYITVPANGQYSFTLNSDDGTQLFIGSTLVVDNNQQGENERTGSIGLKAGTHAITVNYLQRGGAQLLTAYYMGPGVPKQAIPTSVFTRATATPTLRTPENPSNTVAGLDYQYYEGSNWSQLPSFDDLTPVKTGNSTSLTLTTRNRNDYFAYRYTGYVDIPADGTYTFYTSSDDGSQLFIGSTLVVDNNGLHGTQEKSGTIGLQKGKHAITITFFDATGDQVLTASYEGPNLSKTQIPAASLLRVPTQATAPTLAAPVASDLRTPENPDNAVAGLNYQYYQGSWTQLPNFDALTPVKTGTSTSITLSTRNQDDNFGYRYTGYVDIPADGTYTFYTSSDDGSQLFIGSTLVVDNNGLHGTQEKSGTIGLQKGKHAITITFFELGGDQTLTASYECAAAGIAKTQLPTSALYRVSTSATITPSLTATTTSFYRAINLNGPGINLDGNTWESGGAANLSYQGYTAENQYVTLNPSTDNTRANMIRSMVWGNNTNVSMTSVPSGTYDVYLYTWEDNYPETFSLAVEGTTVLSNYNSGSAGTWKKLGPYRIAVTDGTLNVNTQGGAANLSGLEVWRVASGSATSSTSAVSALAATQAVAVRTGELYLHPNPTSGQVYLETDTNDWTQATVRDTYGTALLSQKRTSSSLTMDVSSLQPGVYIVEVLTGAGQLLRSKLNVQY